MKNKNTWNRLRAALPTTVDESSCMADSRALVASKVQGKRCRTLVLVLALMALVYVDSAQAQGYGGPSLLSRGGNRPGRRGRGPVNFTFYGAIRGTYDTGLLPVTLGSDNRVTSVDLAGIQAELGLYGGHTWRRTSVGLDYRGDW